MAMIAEESWLSPQTWMSIADRFGVAVLVIFAFGAFIGFCLFCLWRIYRGWEPLLKREVESLSKEHRKFLDTCSSTMVTHANANEMHSRGSIASANGVAAIMALHENLSESVEASAKRISDVIRKLDGGFEAGLHALDEASDSFKDNPNMLRAISRVRMRLMEAKK